MSWSSRASRPRFPFTAASSATPTLLPRASTQPGSNASYWRRAHEAGELSRGHRAVGSPSDCTGVIVNEPRISTGFEPILTVIWNENVLPRPQAFELAPFAWGSLALMGVVGGIAADPGG